MHDILTALGIDWRLVLTQFLGFILLLWFLNRFAYTPAMKFLDQRQADIKNTYDQMDLDRQRMEEARRQYEERLHGIEEEARERIQAAVKEAQTLRDNMVADAQQQAEAIVERGRNESERERQKAFLEMRQQVVALAVAAAGKVVGETLNDVRHTRLVDEFIEGVATGRTTVPGRSGADGAGSSNGTGGATAA